MPLLNSSEGKIRKILTVARYAPDSILHNGLSQIRDSQIFSIVTDYLQDKFSASLLKDFIAAKEPNAEKVFKLLDHFEVKDNKAAFQLTEKLKEIFLPNLRIIPDPISMPGVELNTTDYIAAFVNKQKNTQFYNVPNRLLSPETLSSNFGPLYAKQLNANDPFVQGGDYIAANNFLIIGPASAQKFNTQNSLAAFLSFYCYPRGWKENVLLLKTEDANGNDFNRVWQGEWPLFHLDNYLTYGGLYNNQHLFFIAEVNEDCIAIERNPASRRLMRSLIPYLNFVKVQLKKKFGPDTQFVYLPMFLHSHGKDGTNAQTYFYSMNNALVEIYPNGNGDPIKRFYLPKYIDFPEDIVPERFVDLINNSYPQIITDIQSTYGFQQVPIEVKADPHIISGHGNSLHCMCAVIERDPFKQ